MQYMGLCVFSLPISLMMIVKIPVPNLIIIIKSEVWPICHCLWLGHETMVCALCFSIFLDACFDKNLILGCLWLLVFVLNILILGIWCSTIPHLPGCFCPWTFFQNIGFNTVLTDPFMSHLATQLGYSAGEFQALQLIVLAAFGVVD